VERTPTARRPPTRIGVLADLGPVGSASVAAWMALRVLRVELGRRLPGVEVVAISQAEIQTPLDGGEPAIPAGPWTSERRTELAAGMRCVVVLAPEPTEPTERPESTELHEPTEATVRPEPTELHEPTEATEATERPESCAWPPPDGLGPEHEATCPSITLDPGALCALTPLVLDERILDLRLAWLRLLGLCPGPEVPLLLDAGGKESKEGVDELAARLGASPFALAEPLSLEDVAALVRSATVVVGGQELEGLTSAYGTRLVSPDGSGDDLDLASRQRWAGTLLDAVVSTAQLGRAHDPPAPDQLLQVALAERQRQGWRYRRLLAEHSAAAAEYRAEIETRLGELRKQASQAWARFESEAAAQRAELEALAAERDAIASERDLLVAQRDGMVAALAEAESGRAATERELEATYATRLFRYTAGVRRIYGALRRSRA
jgi:hypothetical protein